MGSRYCAECLAESCGRWQLRWRLGWSFVCLRHSRLLADACAECGKRQWLYQGYCHAPIPATCPCGASLTATQNLQLPANHPIFEAQRQIFDVIDEGNVDFGVFSAQPVSVREVLAAVRSLANRVLNLCIAHGLTAVKPPEVHRGCLSG